MIELAPGIHLPDSLVEFTFARSSGPGGQNVNKLSTKAQLRISLADLTPRLGHAAIHRLAALAGSRLTPSGDIIITADDSRSQAQNRKLALHRLRELLIQAMAKPKRRRPTRPSAGSRARRLESKSHRSTIKSTRRSPNHD